MTRHVPPLISWTDKTHHIQAADCKASRTVEVSAVAWDQQHLDSPSAFSRPGQPETRQQPRQKRRGSGKPSLMPVGTPSNSMAASTPSWTGSTKRGTKPRPRPEQDRSTISASGGQGRAVVWVATLQGWGGASRWCTRLAITKLHYQRAQPSPLWSRLFLKIHIGHGVARIARVLCGKAR